MMARFVITITILFISCVFAGSAFCKDNTPCLEKMIIGRTDNLQNSLSANKKYFLDLKKVDATLLRKGEEQSIGRVLSLSKISIRKAVRLLLESQIIKTYWHLEAKLCLVKEDKSKERDILYYQGTHTYCTNECLNNDFEFAVKVSNITGEIILLGPGQI